MAYSEIAQALVNVGKPVVQLILQKCRDNFIDLDSRVTTLEGGVGKIEVWNDNVLNADSASSLTGLDHYVATAAFSLVTARVEIFAAGSLTGDLEIDILKSTTGNTGTFTTIFSTKPKIDLSTASDGDTSADHTAAVFSVTNVAVDDVLRLDVTSLPSGGVIGSFRVLIIGELS